MGENRYIPSPLSQNNRQMTTDTGKVGYQFTPMPKQLTHLLDVNLRSMLFALVDASDYFADEDGWFYRSNADLQIDSATSQNLVKATVDTLFIYSFLEVTCVGKGKKREPNGYRLNKGMFKFFERLDMNSDIHRPENKIRTVDYKGSGYHPSYLDDEPERYLPELVKGKIIWNQINPSKAITTGDTAVSTTESAKELTTDVTKSDNNIDNIETEYNKEYKDNIEDINNVENVNKDYVNSNNILKDKLDNKKEKLDRKKEEGKTEPMTRNEEEGKENPIESQLDNKKPSGEDQDCIPGENQGGEAKGEGSSHSQPSEDNPRPSSLKELQDYFHKRLRQEFKVRIPENENVIHQSKEKLYRELEEFSDIRDYKQVGYMINDACRKETDRLLERLLASK